MPPAAPLQAVLQALRGHRRPVTAVNLASELGVSLRAVHRDIAALKAQGEAIEGDAGSGYRLPTRAFLPPLLFEEDEADTLILGLRLAASHSDGDFEEAADSALAKIAAVLPLEQGDAAGSGTDDAPHVATIRHALRAEEKLHLRYTDKKDVATARTVWPVALGFFSAAEVLAAWCETRQGFRHFRLDRIAAAERTGQRTPRRRRVLLAEWRIEQDMDGG